MEQNTKAVGLISKAIDPKRTGISKSAVTTAALCGRMAWYDERRRMPDGGRRPLELNERIQFGALLDRATGWVMEHLRAGNTLPEGWAGEAVVYALSDLSGAEGRLPVDPESQLDELYRAVSEFEPHAVRMVATTQPGGRVWLQGWDGQSLSVGEGPNKAIGTPDIILERRTPDGESILGLTIVDIKSAGRAKSDGDLRGPEMAHYSMLAYEQMNEQLAGEDVCPPPAVAYLTWVRTKTTPRWQWLETDPMDMSLIQLGRIRLGVMRGLLAATEPDQVPFATMMCGTCEWRDPHAETGHPGCEAGLLSVVHQQEQEA